MTIKEMMLIGLVLMMLAGVCLQAYVVWFNWKHRRGLSIERSRK